MKHKKKFLKYQNLYFTSFFYKKLLHTTIQTYFLYKIFIIPASKLKPRLLLNLQVFPIPCFYILLFMFIFFPFYDLFIYCYLLTF